MTSLTSFSLLLYCLDSSITLFSSCYLTHATISRHMARPCFLCQFSCTQDSMSSIRKFNTCCLCKLTFLLSDLNQLVEEPSGSSRQSACPEAMRRRPWLQLLVGVICLWNCTCWKQRLPSYSSDTLPRLPSCQKPPKP